MRLTGAHSMVHGASAVLAGISLMAVINGAPAESTTLTQASGELVVRLEVVAPPTADADAMHLLERQLHRGVKPAGKIYHVLVAVYDAPTGRRSSQVETVTAKIVDSDGTTPATRLEPMSAGGEVGYGNYFDFSPSGPYGIVVSVRSRASEQLVELTFNLAHLPE